MPSRLLALLVVVVFAAGSPAPADEPKKEPDPRIRFTAPKGWRAEPPKGSVAIPVAGRFSAGDKDAPVIVTVMSAGGSLKDNVNRWRGQLKLEPLDDAGVKKAVSPVKVGGREGHLFVATGTGDAAQRIVVALVPDGDATWFIRMSGPAVAVEREVKAFDRFLASVTFPK